MDSYLFPNNKCDDDCSGNNYINSANTHCIPCSVICNGCQVGDSNFCTACAQNYLLVTDVPGKCVADCTDQGSNYYEDNG